MEIVCHPEKSLIGEAYTLVLYDPAMIFSLHLGRIFLLCLTQTANVGESLFKGNLSGFYLLKIWRFCHPVVPYITYTSCPYYPQGYCKCKPERHL